MDAIIYKILRNDEWQEAERAGMFRGSPDDTRDGYIHCSTAEQTIATYEKYFAGDAVLAAVDANVLGASVKWEPSRGGALFPHIYGQLPLSAVRWSQRFSSVG